MENQHEGIKLVAVWHHMHLLGSSIKTNVIRNGVELEPVSFDESYDFDYQDNRLLRHEYNVLPVRITNPKQSVYRLIPPNMLGILCI
jgi:hypothetical protein